MAVQPTEPTATTQTLMDEFAALSDDEQYERMHNAASFVDIPMEQIPGDKMMRLQIKLALKLRALSGHDCYAYRPANQREFVIWDRQPDPATESRFTPREWAIRNGFAVSETTDGKESA